MTASFEIKNRITSKSTLSQIHRQPENTPSEQKPIVIDSQDPAEASPQKAPILELNKESSAQDPPPEIPVEDFPPFQLQNVETLAENTSSEQKPIVIDSQDTAEASSPREAPTLELDKESSSQNPPEIPVEDLPPFQLQKAETLDPLWKQLDQIQAKRILIPGFERSIDKRFLLEAKGIPGVTLDILFSQKSVDDGTNTFILSGFEKVVLMKHSSYFKGFFEGKLKEDLIQDVEVLNHFIENFYEPDSTFLESLSLSPFEPKEDIEHLLYYLENAYYWEIKPALEKLTKFLLEQFKIALENDPELTKKLGIFCDRFPDLQKQAVQVLENSLDVKCSQNKFYSQGIRLSTFQGLDDRA